MTKKRMIIALVAVLSLMVCGSLIAGCAQQSAAGSTAISSGDAAVQQEDEIYGTIVLRVNPEIAVSYDKQGNVVKVEGLNDDGRALVPSDDEFVGQPCRSVVETLLGKFNDAGFLVEEVEGEGRQVQIELEDGSHMPTHNFLNDIVEGADSYAHTNKVNAVFAVSGTTDYGWSYYDDTDYGPSNDGVTDYDDTDYGPNNDGDSRYDDKNDDKDDGKTDYAGKTDYDKDNTDYGNSNYTKPSSGSSSGGSASTGGSTGGSSGGNYSGGDSGYSNYGGNSNYNDSAYNNPSPSKPSGGNSGSSGGTSKPSGGSSGGSSGGGSSTPAPQPDPTPTPDPVPVTPPSGGGGGNSDYGDSNYGGGNSNYGGGDSGYSNYGDSGYDD